MKKLFSIATFLFLAFTLIACGPKQSQTINLSYADWGDQAFNQQMIDAFMDANPGIKVTLTTEITGSGRAFTENLVKAAEAGLLPDVFATDNVPSVITNGLALDVAQLFDADDDAKLIYPNFVDTAIYNGKRYAVPSFQFFKGIAINKNLIKEQNLVTVPGKYRIDEEGLPVKDWTYSEMIEIASAVANRSLDDGKNFRLGIEPWYGTMDFNQVWPSLDGEDTQYDTWDGTKFNYTSEAWIKAMKEKVRVHKLGNGTIDDITDEDIYVMGEDGKLTTTVRPNRDHLVGWKLTTGYTAMGIHGTWNLTGLIAGTKANNIDMGFWPYPAGSAGQFPPVILDYQCVSSQTKHQEAAYKLAKWMTYGRAGMNARMDIFKSNYDKVVAEGEEPARLSSFPVANYPEVWEKINPYIQDVDGLDAIIKNIDKSKPDLDKWVPGYRDFWNWVLEEPTNDYSWKKLLEQGEASVAQFAEVWNKKVNELLNSQMAELGK